MTKKQQKKATKELPKLSDSEEHAVTCSEERLAHEAHARAARTCREADKGAAIDGGGVAAILSKRRREKAEGELLEAAERLREAQRQRARVEADANDYAYKMLARFIGER